MGKALQMDTSGLLSFGATNPGWVSNLGLKYGADSTTGRMKIVAADGTNLSSTNKAWVTCQSATTACTYTRIKFDYTTHVHYFEDDAAATSDIAGEQFGCTTGIAWGNDRPFFLYAVNSADTAAGLAFAISPDPSASTSPATTNSGYHGNPAATPSDINFFYLTSVDVTVTHQLKPCTLIGAFRMRMSASDDWTVQTLSNADGIGPFAIASTLATRYTMPLAQMGASTGTYIHPNSGTAPVFTTNQYTYQLHSNGLIRAEVYVTGDGGTDGVGAVECRLALPYGYKSGTMDLYMQFLGYGSGATTITGGQSIIGLFVENTTYVALQYLDAAAVAAGITNAMFSSGARELRLTFTYNGFKN